MATLEELVRRIFEQILKEANTQNWFSKISEFFGKYIQSIGLFGISVGFNPREEDLKILVRNFPEALSNLIEKIKDEKKGLFIVLDDINGISRTSDFADWYKSFVDTAATHFHHFPVIMMPIGLPEIRDQLSRNQPSLMRVFRVVEIDKLSDLEVQGFFEKAFELIKVKVETEAMKIMVIYSSGLPILMHEIGDAVYHRNDDMVIYKVDATLGIIEAAERIGKKYLDPKVYRAIRSVRYISILRKLGEASNFRKSDIEKRLNPTELKVFHNFLRRMKDLGIIIHDEEGGSGSYKYVNNIYPIYIWMESQRSSVT
ncbi:MAG: hypothetical protein Q8O92_01935 [Candidatus Latescibacter sp.]|nr:hypothetical protein [Candidatus Latescibacter sp.]